MVSKRIQNDLWIIFSACSLTRYCKGAIDIVLNDETPFILSVSLLFAWLTVTVPNFVWQNTFGIICARYSARQCNGEPWFFTRHTSSGFEKYSSHSVTLTMWEMCYSPALVILKVCLLTLLQCVTSVTCIQHRLFQFISKQAETISCYLKQFTLANGP